ncbi:TRAP transporter substrate-binding protein [Hominifimenecus sp. rT4P-3]|uniref:TRAP transporter substrate-binding protein n=1 Tax=Hominifimenecus sp. rT4P-3 TaxID=3242979 RepID=UPI003DA264D2
MKARKIWTAMACTMACVLTACGGGQSGEKSSAAADTTAAVTTAEAAAGSSTAETTGEGSTSLAAAEYLSGEYDALPEDGEKYNLSIAYAGGENTEGHVVMSALKEALEYYSNGKITVALYPNGQLGSDAEMIASCIAGDIDIVMQCGSTHATFVPETQIFDTPFLFSGVDIKDVEAATIDSEFRDLYNAANEKAGLKCLMLKAAETMDLTSNKAVYSLDDLKGLKIRTAQTESRMLIWSSLGANPTPLAYSELYMALQNGTVEASDNIYSNDVTGGFGEQQKYIIPTDHFLVSVDLTMNLETFQAMPAEYQNMITKICEEISHYDYALTVADIDKNLQTLIQDYDMEVCEISDEFRTSMVEAAKPAIESAKEMVGNDALYEALDKSLGR